MKNLIDIDSFNYMFASNRLKRIPEFADLALEDDGMLLRYAPDEIKSNKELVKIAFKSNNLAIKFASKELQKDKIFKIKKKKVKEVTKEELKAFLKANYLTEEKKKNLGFRISNKSQFFPENELISRNYIIKWQRNHLINPEKSKYELKLIAADSRNSPTSWKEDFKKYPDLIKKIEKFFLKHNIDQNTIDRLSTTFLWKIKDDPQTLAFNLYLLRDSSDADLGPEFSNISSLTAIVQKRNGKLEMTVIEVIFDSEMEVKVDYNNGHKKYVLWDLFTKGENDKNPKIIFKVEDDFKEYFKIFAEEDGGKYESIYQIETN